MRVAYSENGKIRSFYCQITEDRGEYFHDLSEDTPAKCFKDLICDALYAVKNKVSSNLYINGKIHKNTKENIIKVLENLSTGYLIDMRYYYIAEGNWRHIEESEYNISDTIDQVLTEREHKSVIEINEMNDARCKFALETEKKLKESKTFQKFLKSMQFDAENSWKVKKILEIMETF